MSYLFLFALFLSHITSVVSRPSRAQAVVEVDGAYDFIIVGGGLSGLTVADRLTENPSSTL
jgi:ribulose 1,5-bisphosphate synthetase/thiazole synthase